VNKTALRFLRLQSVFQEQRDTEPHRPEGTDLIIGLGEDLRPLVDLVAKSCLVEFPASYYAQIHHEADVYTTEVIAGMKWHGDPNLNLIPEGEHIQHVEMIEAAGRGIPFPDFPPFPHTMFMFDTLVEFTADQCLFYGQALASAVKMHKARAWLVGYYVGQYDKKAAVFFLLQRPDGVTGYTFSWVHNEDLGGWVEPYSLDCWKLNIMCEMLREFRATLYQRPLRTFGFKRALKKAGHRLPKTPPHFYEVEIRNTVSVQTDSRTEMRRITPASHQYDVRNHERVYVRRGRGPLDPSERAILTEPRAVSGEAYRLYDDQTPLTMADHHRLRSRGIAPPEPGEWLAVMSVVIDAHRRGPKSAPYIPSVHIVRS